MWKKLIITIVTLLCTFSVVYAMNHEIRAGNIVYNAGGTMKGRINIAPTGVNGLSVGMKKGDRVQMESKNPFNQSNLSWILISKHENYIYYDTPTCTSTYTTLCTGASRNSWFSMLDSPIYRGTSGIKATDYIRMSSGGIAVADYSKSSVLTAQISDLNQIIKANTNDLQLLVERDLTFVKNFKDNDSSNTILLERIKGSIFTQTSENQIGVFTPSFDELSSVLKVPIIDLAFSELYYSSVFYDDTGAFKQVNLSYNTNGDLKGTSLSSSIALRPATFINVDDIVFAVEQGSVQGPAKIEDRDISSSYTSLYTEAMKDSPLKVRIKDTSLQASLLSLEDRNGNSINQIAQGQPVYLNADVNKGVSHTISVLLFRHDEASNSDSFAYYQPLADANGRDKYEFDTSSLETGTYKLSIVNEIYDSSKVGPSNSSSISQPISIEIVSELSDLTFTATPSLEYSKNVSNGDTVGMISSQNGAGTPAYKLVADPSYANDIDHFDLDTNGKTVIIKGDALEAGTYHFKIQAQDGNGDPTTPLEISASITVAKTNPDLKFTTTSVIDKIVGDSSFTETFTHKNTDTKDASFKLTYSSLIPDVAVVDTPTANTDTDIEITPGSTNGSTNIKVELAETKNFKSANATLAVNVHPKISLSFTPDKNSFAVNEVATFGTKIGSVSLTGNSPPYEYTMALDQTDTDAGANNALFDVKTTGKTNATSMDIITNSPSIPQGTYKITIQVEDAYGQIAYAKGTIKIAGMAQTGFDFYDYRNASNKLTNSTLTIYYGEDSAELIAQGGQSSGLTYAPDDPTQTVLTINPYDGTLVTNDIGKVKVKATKPADGTYSEAVIYMYVEVKPCEQEITFDKMGNTTISYDNTNGISFSETATGKIKSGMPKAGEPGFGKIEYSLGGTDKGIASISPSTGEITINAGQNITTMKTFTVTVKLNDGNTKNPKYGSASATKTVNVYPPGSASWTQTNTPQADNNTGTEKIGDLTVTGGSGNAKFSISTSGDADNLDKEFFDIDPTSGEVVLIKQITVTDIASKVYNSTEEAYEMKVMVDIHDGGNTTTEHLTIYINGAERPNLDFRNRDTITQEITETYDVNKSFNLSLNQSIQGTNYRMSTNPSHASPNDVITISANGKADIQNANEVSISGSTTAPVYVEAVVPPSSGYKEMIIEAPVRIKRTTQSLTFSQNPINTSADIQSLTITMSGHKDGNNLVYSSSDSKVKAIADPTDSDTFTIKPNGVVKNGITITAIAQGDRNYKDTMKTATLNIAQAGKNQFTATFPSMTYGESGPFQVTIAPAGSGNETYTYVVKDTSIVEIDANGNITPHHAGTTTVDVTQTSAGGTVGPYTFTITVDPKPITVTIEDKSKYTGMEMPAFTVDIPSADVVAGDTIPIPEFRCVDTNGFDVDANTGADSYPITGTYPNPPSDYDITLVNGKLTVSQDNGSQSWYELQDISGNKTSSNVWHKDAVDVVLKPATGSAGVYDQIANDPTFSNQDLTRFTVSEEGETIQDIYFRIDPNGSDSNKGAITLPIQEMIRIDNTKPVIKSIVGTNKGTSQVRLFLNALTFGQFFKPGMVVTIHAEDIEPTQGVMVSGIQKVSYKISKLDEQGKPVGTPNTMDQNDTTVELSLTEDGAYEVCATAMDKAGNISTEKCEVMKIRTWGESSDENEVPDINIDLDGDGIADINITRPGEKKPYLNIDTNGDGIPDINISRAGEEVIPGKTEPYLNIMDPRVKWNPTKEIDYDEDGSIDFRTDETLSAILSIDSNNDKIPDLNIDIDDDYVADLNINVDGKYTSAQTNIDSTGDGKADINIDIEGDGKPDERIASNYIWNPIYYVKDKDGNILYGTTKDIEIDVIDSITDKGIIVKPGEGADKFLPNYALKVNDITTSISEKEQESILSKREDMEIDNVYEIVMMEDEESIQPDGSIEVSIPYDGEKENVVVLVKNAKGEWVETAYEIKGDYLQFKTDYLGEVSILKSKEKAQDPEPEEPKKPVDNPEPSGEKPSTSVQGSYTTQGSLTSGMGGAYTGDHTNAIGYGGLMCFAFLSLVILTFIKKKESSCDN